MKEVRHQGRGRPAQTPVPDITRIEASDKECCTGCHF